MPICRVAPVRHAPSCADGRGPQLAALIRLHGQTSADKGYTNMRDWLRNVWLAVSTVAKGMGVTLRYWLITYRPDRGTFTEKYVYPEKPLVVSDRYRGFHRYDLTACIACLQCAKVCPVDCLYIGREKVQGGKGFEVTTFSVDYSKCLFCGLCTEACPEDCILMGATHDLSC